jgi:hypothetical protein
LKSVAPGGRKAWRPPFTKAKELEKQKKKIEDLEKKVNDLIEKKGGI